MEESGIFKEWEAAVYVSMSRRENARSGGSSLCEHSRLEVLQGVQRQSL
jgi:hypothetical protein